MSSPDYSALPTIDVGRVIDEGPFTTLQKFVVATVAMAVIIDGFDTQLIGFAIPIVAKEWAVTKAAFAPVVAIGLFGMGIGGICAGWIADRLGRRWALIGSVILFGIATITIGLTHNMLEFGLVRFFAGLGLGGAVPSSTTMAAEFSPLRRRTLAVTSTIVCMPLGGMFTGLFASQVLPRLGWRPLFMIGGTVPLLFALIVFLTLPESPRYLARCQQRWGELSALLSRLRVTAPAGTVFTDRAEQKAELHKGFSALLKPEFGRDSLALWCAFFMCMVSIYSCFNWLPTMLISAGLTLQVASAGLTAYNTGGVIGALLCAVIIARFGSRTPLLAFSLAAAASAFVLIKVPFQEHESLLVLGLAANGFFVNAVQSTMFALCAHVYPTVVRATGTASATLFGRTGAFVSSFAAAAAITNAGSFGYLVLLGTAMILVFLALAVVRNHIPVARTHALQDASAATYD